MGIIERSKRSRGWVTRLLLYREAVDNREDVPADVDVIAVLEGTVFDVRCSICGRTRTWYAGDVEMDALLDSVRESREKLEGLEV